VNFIPNPHLLIQGASGLFPVTFSSVFSIFSSTFGIIFGGLMKGNEKLGFVKTVYFLPIFSLRSGKCWHNLEVIGNGVIVAGFMLSKKLIDVVASSSNDLLKSYFDLICSS